MEARKEIRKKQIEDRAKREKERSEKEKVFLKNIQKIQSKIPIGRKSATRGRRGEEARSRGGKEKGCPRRHVYELWRVRLIVLYNMGHAKNLKFKIFLPREFFRH